MSGRYNELICLAKDSKKKGGSLGAIFKLIQDLLEFEDKIVECAESQEMGENRSKIEALKAETGEMYNNLFEMAQGGVDSYRNKLEVMEGIEDPRGREDEEVEGLREREEITDEPTDKLLDMLPKEAEVSKACYPTSLRMPEPPKM